MTKKIILYATLALLVLVIMMAAGFSLYRQHASLPTALPSPAEWSSAISTSTPQTLAGTITGFKSGSLTLVVQQPPIGSVAVAAGSSTPITKNTPKTPAEMATAFKEFQKEQAAANGKPFTAPSASNITTLSFSELKAGNFVIVTLTPGSTKDNFTAQHIEVVPAGQGGTADTRNIPPKN